MGYIVSAFIFFSCTAYISGQTFDDTQIMVFKIGIFLIWIMTLYLKPARSVRSLWLNSLLALVFLETLMLNGEPQKIAIEPLINSFLAVVLFYSLVNYLKDIKPIIRGICWAVGAQAVIILLQGTGLDPICLNDAGKHNTHFVGLFGYKFVFGAWMAIVTPILLFNKRYFFGALSFVMCILSMSVAPIGLMMSVLIAGSIMLDRKYAKFVIPAVIVAATLAWVFILNKPCNQSLYHKAWLRVTLESKFLPIVFQKPLFGWGLGSFKFIGPQVWNINTGTYGTMIDAWNDWLQQSVECGLVFFVMLAGLCWDIVKTFMKSSKKHVAEFCSLSIIPVGMLFHNYMGHSNLGVLMICIYAAFIIRSNDEAVSS